MKFNIKRPDQAIRPAIEDKINNLTKPKGSLGRLEELALQMCLIQQTTEPELKHPCNVVFAADHGIVDEGVSFSPKEVTWQQLFNFVKGGGGINFLCRQHGFELVLVDAGVDYDGLPYDRIINKSIRKCTDNYLHGPAMSRQEMERCLESGASVVDSCQSKGCNVISFGELGMGNTSSSSIWMHYFTGTPLEQCVGAGSGLATEGIIHKYEVLKAAVDKYSGDGSVEDIMAYFGGFEMVMAVGAMLRAAELGMTVLVDGFIMTACALMAVQMHPAVLDYMIFCHQGEESGHRLMLEAMGARGLLNLGFRLGEGTGAVCAYPIVESAVRMINEMDSFRGASVTKYFK